MKVYNTQSRKVEDFRPLVEKKVSLYSCGPTVYNFAHIGNLRAFVFADVLKRSLRFLGFTVNHVMNITDVDDKIIRDSKAQNKSRKEFTDFYEAAFFDDLSSLNVEPADEYPRATEYVEQMQKLIQQLFDNGLAYVGSDGSVYFSVSKHDAYGKLAHIDKSKLQSGASGRVKKDEYTKDEANDFALWKAYDDDDADVFWSPTFTIDGKETTIKGRPGWHIECSAMSTALLGNSFDIHTGGVDLVFPHHENEIAQSEGATGQEFVKYWMHNEHLLVDGGKMSKSLGNFYTIRDLIKKGYDPIAFRLLILQAHYRSQLNFTLDSLQAAEQSLTRLNDFVLRLQEVSKEQEASSDVSALVRKGSADFSGALENDLDTPKAIEVVFSFVKEIYNIIDTISASDAQAILGFMEGVDSVLGVMTFEHEKLPEDIQALITEREQARANKNWARSDEIRDLLKEKGYVIEDTTHGTRWKRSRL